VGRPHPSPHIQLAAVSQDQTDNTMSLVLAMLGEGTAAAAIPGLDLSLTRVRTANGKLEQVTTSAPSRQGHPKAHVPDLADADQLRAAPRRPGSAVPVSTPPVPCPRGGSAPGRVHGFG
jgi:hypothetical protein